MENKRIVRQEIVTYSELEDKTIEKVIITRVFLSGDSYEETHTKIILK